MPGYNDQTYLASTIGGLLRQTWRDFKLLALDDGSTDDTWSLL